MGECGRHHGKTRSERLHQHAGRDLDRGVVWQEDDVDLRQQPRHLLIGQIVVRHGEHVGDAQVGCQTPHRLAVSLAVREQHIGMGGAPDQVAGERAQMPEIGQGPDPPLQALPGPEQSPGADRGARPGIMDLGPGELGRAVGDHSHLLGIDGVCGEESLPGRTGHHDQQLTPAGEPLDDLSLYGRRFHQHRVERGDQGPGRSVTQLQQLPAAVCSVDAELVLDPDHIEAEPGSSDLRGPRRVIDRDLHRDLGDLRDRFVVPAPDPGHRQAFDGPTRLHHARRQGSGEGGDPAPRRRIRAHEQYPRVLHRGSTIGQRIRYSQI